MKIAVIDDMETDRQRLAEMLCEELESRRADNICVYTFASGEEFLQRCQAETYEMVFLDIFMGGMNGVEVARSIRRTNSEIRLIFCSSSNGFASESYEVKADYYLCKPVDRSTIQSMLKHIELAGNELDRYLVLPDGQKLILRNIIYTEYRNHIITVYSKAGDNIQVRMSQLNFEKLLEQYPFLVSCSKGIMVNFYEVQRREDNVFFMSNSCPVPISRRKYKEIVRLFADFIFQKVRQEVGE